MAKSELGTKRECPHCGSRYYDLDRDPIVCPACGTALNAAVKSKPPVQKDEVPGPENSPKDDVSDAVAGQGAEVDDGENDADDSVLIKDGDDTFIKDADSKVLDRDTKDVEA